MFLCVFFHADHVELTNTSDNDCRRCRWRGGGEKCERMERNTHEGKTASLVQRDETLDIYIKENESNNNTLQSLNIMGTFD